jgi:hypothetical protein
MTGWMRFLKSFGIAAILGFVSFVLSAHELSGILSTAVFVGIFYYDYFVRRESGRKF